MGRNIPLGTHFEKLNQGWDAEAGAPEPKLRTDKSGLTLTFFLSSPLNPKFRKYDCGEIFFPNCWRYRLGFPNDEGWEKGHCRFRCWAPAWGDFYEVTGDLLDAGASDWLLLKSARPAISRHFLLYFKDETFECDAEAWSFKVVPMSDPDYERLRASEIRVTFPRTTLFGVIKGVFSEPFRAARRWFR